MDPETEKVNVEDALQNLFATSVSGSGEEELLRIASKFSLQLSTGQIKCLLYLENLAYSIEKTDPTLAKQMLNFVERWFQLKQHNHSDVFVMKALEQISLRKFFNENSFKVDIQK